MGQTRSGTFSASQASQGVRQWDNSVGSLCGEAIDRLKIDFTWVDSGIYYRERFFASMLTKGSMLYEAATRSGFLCTSGSVLSIQKFRYANPRRDNLNYMHTYQANQSVI